MFTGARTVTVRMPLDMAKWIFNDAKDEIRVTMIISLNDTKIVDLSF